MMAALLILKPKDSFGLRITLTWRRSWACLRSGHASTELPRPVFFRRLYENIYRAKMDIYILISQICSESNP